MGNSVIFAHPRWDYASYSDYKSLVALAGYPTCYMDEIDTASDNTYIFSTPDTHWWHGWANAKARIIYFNLEWYLDADYNSIPGVETWSTDKWYADLKGLRYVPMGSDARLNPEPNIRYEPEHVATLWAASGNRYAASGSMYEAGITVAPNAWGNERHELLKRSYAMIHAHQDKTTPTVAPQRFALAAAYHLPLVSETLGDAGVFDGIALQTSAEHMGEYIADTRRQSSVMRKAADRLYKLLCEDMTFKKSVEAAL